MSAANPAMRRRTATGANPWIAACFVAAFGVYATCCAVTVLAALSTRGEPRPNHIARPKSVERVQPSIGPAINHGGAYVLWRAGE